MKTLISILLCNMPLYWGVAGTIEGIVHRTTKQVERQTINRYSGRTSVQHNDHSQHGQNNDQAIVYLISKKEGNYPEPTERPKMEQINEAFRPWLLPIMAGTTVDFPNSDPIFHNVFSYSKTKKFDLGRYGEGESKSVTFDKPGLVKVFCEIHKNMRAYIMVLDNPFFTTTDESGYFILEDIPPGSYTLKAWQENLPEYKTKLKVTESDTLYIEID